MTQAEKTARKLAEFTTEQLQGEIDRRHLEHELRSHENDPTLKVTISE